MDIGEVIGLLFLLVLVGIFGAYVYCGNCCPECGGFRTIKTVEADHTAIDNTVDGKDIIYFLLSEGDHRSKESHVKWIDCCKRCGYETQGEHTYRHY